MNTKVESLIKKIAKYNSQLKKLQSECVHDKVIAHYDSSTGGFDPMDDRYWIVVQCLDCDKRMVFDSTDHKDEYYRFSKFANNHK